MVVGGVIQIGPNGGRYVRRRSKKTGKWYKVYTKACKGNRPKGAKKGRGDGQKRKVHIGPSGGQYCLVNGRKRYLPFRPSKYGYVTL